jgi:quercetin dioxygenase-like cupin family protein
MAKLEKKSLDSPDETRSFDKGRFGLVHVGDVTVGRYEFQPGWRWSESVKPIAGTDSCQNHHVGYVIGGRLGSRLDDGTEQEFGPGDVYVIPPGHDGWVVGDEPFVGIEWKSAETYAQSS